MMERYEGVNDLREGRARVVTAQGSVKAVRGEGVVRLTKL